MLMIISKKNQIILGNYQIINFIKNRVINILHLPFKIKYLLQFPKKFGNKTCINI